MANQDCKMARGLKIIFGLLFGFIALALFITGFTFLPMIGFFMAAIFFVISFLFLLAPRDSACYTAR